jgi:uncharacterized protein with GYD domain
MPLYLVQAKYSAETFKRLIINPEDRRIVSKEKEGVHDGKFHGMWYGFGEFDVYAIIEASSNVAAAAFLARQRSSGAFTDVRTVPLMTVDEMLEALKKAADIEYWPPGGRGLDA